MKKQIKIEDFNIPELERILVAIPIGRTQDLIVSRKKDGTETRRTYKKISDTYVEHVRTYEYS